jgi:type I restriction enzyme S subunit
MSNSFKTYYIRDIGKVSMCKRVLKEETFEDEEIPFYKISTFGGKADTFISRKHYQEYRDKYSFPKVGEILISAAGTIGKTVIYNGEDGYFQDSNIVWVENDETKVRNDYLYYFFQTKPWFTTHGSTITRIYNDNLRSIKLNVPDSLFEQQKIASVLSALDSKIELNNRINAELEAMAKTLYDYWFVQFDFPFDFAQGKPNANGKPYKSSGGKMVWNEELKREIPEGWEVKKVEDCMRIVRGASPRPIDEFMSESGVPWIKISDATSIDHWFIIETKEFIKEDGVKHSRELLPGTLILSNSASPGIPRIVQIRSCVHDGWLIVDSFKDGLYNEFMLFYFENFRNKILNMGSGSIFKNLKTEYIKELRITLPPTNLLESSQDLFRNFATQILKNVSQNQQLTELRDWLLPMLMNGQVKVMDEEENELSMAAEPKIEYGK